MTQSSQIDLLSTFVLVCPPLFSSVSLSPLLSSLILFVLSLSSFVLLCNLLCLVLCLFDSINLWSRSVDTMRLLKILSTLLPVGSGALAMTTTNSHPDDGIRVVPLPTSYTSGHEVICLSPDFEIHYDDSLKTKDLPKDLLEATKRTEARLWSNRHQYLSVPRGAEFFASPDLRDGCKHSLQTLNIVIENEGEVGSIMDSATRPAEDRPELERYTLSVPLSGSAILKAPTALGVLRGLTTFEHLFYYIPHSPPSLVPPSKAQSELELESVSNLLVDGRDHKQEPWMSNSNGHGIWYAPTAPYEIEDKPAFGWRAIMLDTSRNWFSKNSIFKVSHPSAIAS